MFTANKPFGSKFVLFFLSFILSSSCISAQCPAAAADTNELNFKIYNPDSASGQTSNSAGNASNDQAAAADPIAQALKSPIGHNSTPAAAAVNQSGPANPGLSAETPHSDASAVQSDSQTGATSAKTAATDKNSVEKGTNTESSDSTTAGDTTATSGNNKVLQGYVRVVPSGTKIPIVMDTAVDSDTSQEGDEFSARTVEDLTIDGTTVIPAGSIIRGRIATLASPKHLNRSGSVALKFDTVTTPDNRQIPLVANLVARGGVVHARRGIKDISIDTATFALPAAIAMGIGAVAGHSSASLGIVGGALIGTGVGAAVGLGVLLAKKGKKVDVRPGDELKIELAEDLHMPTM